MTWFPIKQRKKALVTGFRWLSIALTATTTGIHDDNSIYSTLLLTLSTSVFLWWFLSFWYFKGVFYWDFVFRHCLYILPMAIMLFCAFCNRPGRDKFLHSAHSPDFLLSIKTNKQTLESPLNTTEVIVNTKGLLTIEVKALKLSMRMIIKIPAKNLYLWADPWLYCDIVLEYLLNHVSKTGLRRCTGAWNSVYIRPQAHCWSISMMLHEIMSMKTL